MQLTVSLPQLTTAINACQDCTAASLGDVQLASPMIAFASLLKKLINALPIQLFTTAPRPLQSMLTGIGSMSRFLEAAHQRN
ncbi:hypothetical protein VU08_06775 [Desulfobulbus sp. F5]|nr:hypothetical protein [Desulfobulbus sp. F5]